MEPYYPLHCQCQVNRWTTRKVPDVKNLYTIFRCALLLQLLQNIGSIPHVVQCILVACLPNSLYLLLLHLNTLDIFIWTYGVINFTVYQMWQVFLMLCISRLILCIV